MIFEINETRGGETTYPCETNPSLCCAAENIQLPVSQRESAKVKFESWTILEGYLLSSFEFSGVVWRNCGPSRSVRGIEAVSILGVVVLVESRMT